jgi:hypothetical protein
MLANRILGATVFGLVVASSLAAQAAPPKGATGQCTDGSYTTAKTQARACTKHGGVKTWFAGGAPAAAAPAPAKAPKSAAAGGPPKGSTAECADGS